MVHPTCAQCSDLFFLFCICLLLKSERQEEGHHHLDHLSFQTQTVPLHLEDQTIHLHLHDHHSVFGYGRYQAQTSTTSPTSPTSPVVPDPVQESLMLSNVHCFVLCFAIESRHSIQELSHTWLPKMIQHTKAMYRGSTPPFVRFRFFVVFVFFALFIDLLTDKVQPLSRCWWGSVPPKPASFRSLTAGPWPSTWARTVGATTNTMP